MLSGRPAKEAISATSPDSFWMIGEFFKLRVRDYLQFIKARLSLTVVLSGVVGYWLGAPVIDPAHLLWFTAGTFLVVAGANAFNQILERELDARMVRTAQRPLPTGRIGLNEATLGAGLASATGLLVLFLQAGSLTGGLGLFAFLVYVLVYTPMKRRSSWCTLAGAVSGALPTLMGFAAASGKLAPLAWCLFGIVFFWQFPHTWAIAAAYREDYERVGYRALPKHAVAIETVAATLALVATSLLPAILGYAGSTYTLGALVLGAIFLLSAVRFGSGDERSRSQALLATSLVYLPLMLALAAFSASNGRGI